MLLRRACQVDTITPSVAAMLSLESYLSQRTIWPASGRHILAQFDAHTVVVYQAFRPEIAREAVLLGRFGGAFSRSRMSWIKPNFLWMMYRCGWATKPDQEHVLAVRLRRDFFERVLAAAVASTFQAELFPSRDAWQGAVRASDVRLQWDPDHGPSGAPQDRRAIQLGLRGSLLVEYADRAIVDLADITEFVAAQRDHARSPYSSLQTPAERVFVPASRAAAAAVGLDAPPA
jgi:hypothetical protein